MVLCCREIENDCLLVSTVHFWEFSRADSVFCNNTHDVWGVTVYSSKETHKQLSMAAYIRANISFRRSRSNVHRQIKRNIAFFLHNLGWTVSRSIPKLKIKAYLKYQNKLCGRGDFKASILSLPFILYDVNKIWNGRFCWFSLFLLFRVGSFFVIFCGFLFLAVKRDILGSLAFLFRLRFHSFHLGLKDTVTGCKLVESDYFNKLTRAKTCVKNCA